MKDLISKTVLLVVIGFSSLTYSATPVATAVVNGVSFDTTVVTNDTITLGRNELSIPLFYSSSMWNTYDPAEGVARITVDDESVFETEASEGVFNWTPSCAGTYRLTLTVESVSYQKVVQFVSPTVGFAREGYNSCKLTASDGVSPIRYTTDGSDPTESSTLYTEPFEISPSKWTTVKARTFGEGYLPGEICSEVFGKAGSTVSRAETTIAIDNRSDVRNVPCEAHTLTYDVTWEGDDSSRVTLSADSEKFAERTGSGEIEWMPTREGLTTLSLKTLNESGALEGEYTATFYVWPSEIIVTNGLLPLKEQLTGGIESVRSVIVPEDVEELCADFFKGCSGLKSVTLSDSIKNISLGAFDGCSAITSVTMPMIMIEQLTPGLIQAKFNSSDDFTSSILDSESKTLVSGVLMGDAYDTESATRTYIDPKYGGSHKWNSRYTTFGYAGYMYMVEGRTYVFGKYFDDSVLVRINGNEVLKNTDHTAFATGKYIPVKTGWHEIEVRVADGTGEKGPKGIQNGGYWSGNLGVAWRDDGITSALPESDWNKMMDPGDGSLFRSNAGFMSVKDLLPDSFENIKHIELTGVVKEIPDRFLAGCTSLESFVVPDGVEKIGAYAFAGCTSLQNVEVPESVTQIGTGAFNGCAAMADDDGFLVVRDVLYGYFGDGDCVAIPDGVVAIEAKAFYGCDAISEVIIPSTVRRIGAEAFANCTSLERVVIPSSVTDIGNNAFSGCNSIKNATLPGWKCGINFSNVTNLVIAEGTTNIANYAFQSCYSLESVTLPDSVTHIGYSAFSYCSNLKRVEIPDSVIAIGSYAFGSCNSELYDTTSIPGIKLVDGWAIEVDKSKLPSNLDLTGIRGICGSVFQNCTSLERVVIPDGVKSIGNSAFYGCEALAEVSLPDGLTGDIKSAFSETPFIISDSFPEFILSRSGKTLYGIKTKMFDSAMDREDVYDEMECVDILVPATVEYVGDYALGALSAYIYDPDWGEYHEYGFSSERVIFTGNKPISSDKAFMWEWSDWDVARDEVYYYEGNDGWVWSDDWCGVKTYSLPNIPEECKAASDCTFGRTYGGGWWTDEWMSDGELMQFTEYELWYNNDVGLYGDELAFFPVMTTESLIKPYILLDDTPAAYLDEVEVWTDEQVRRRFIPTGVSAVDWEDDDVCWEYEDDDEYWYWPKDLWSDNRVVAGRKWIVVPVREVKEKWSGVSSFRVGVFGTSAISDPVLVVPSGENEFLTKDVVSGFRGMTIDGVECLYENGHATWDDTIITGYESANFYQFTNNLPISFTITVPSAGTLVMGCKDDEDDSIAQAFSITGSGILSDRVTEMSDIWDDPNYRWGITNFYKTGEADYVRRVKVSKGTTLTFTRNNFEDLECEFTRINFFPQDSKSVAINVAYVCLEEMNGILGNEYWGRHYLKGYVKESGVYKKGETATFEAVSGEEEVFDHWEVCFGPLSLTESQRMSPRLSFVVTDEMCGDMADEEQIFLRAVWKPKYKITALPSIVGAGKVEGSGRYFAGDTVTLTATAATGCTFIKWSDGETSPTRTIEVVPADVERVIYAYFSAPDGVPDPLYWSVLFVGNGGEVGETERLVKKGTAVGELPVPVMEGYEFLGWFTGNEGGEEIRSDSVISRELTLYARWKEIPRTPTELFGGEWKFGVEGTADVGGYKDQTVAGGVSVKFTAEHASEAWIETEVTNGCRVTFSWKADCEELFKGSPYDYLSFEVDGVRQGFICGNKDWEEKSFVISGKGVHHLRWTFRRDEEGGLGNNCAWLANVEITRIYTVEFAVGEATGGEAPGILEYYEGDSVELPDCGSLVKSKHTFAGWSDGTDIYQAGEEYSNDSDTTLTPVWTRNLLQKPVISAPSVFEADICTVEITASDGAEVRYTLDGTDPTSGSILYSGPIVISGTTIVKAIAVKDNHFDTDVSVFTVTRGVWTFDEYLNAPGYIFTDSGDAPWVRAKGVSEDGYALRSGEITHAQKSGIEMKVNGPGTISFACRVEGEIAKKIVWDGLGFYIDGVRQGDLFGNDTWETKTFNVTGAELHTLSWVYEKDEEGDGDGEDCAWLDNVVWTPAVTSDVIVDVGGGKSVVVPTEWIDKYDSIVTSAGGDRVAALQRTAANGRKVWECFMLGVDPTKADDDFKITRFWMENGVPKFEFSHSTDGAGNSFVPRIKAKGKARLTDAWSDVPDDGDASFRFFTVEVALP